MSGLTHLGWLLHIIVEKVAEKGFNEGLYLDPSQGPACQTGMAGFESQCKGIDLVCVCPGNGLNFGLSDGPSEA